jgi:hypothetical protein
MDFVDEQDIAFAEAGEDGGEVSGSVSPSLRGRGVSGAENPVFEKTRKTRFSPKSKGPGRAFFLYGK